MDRLRLCYKPPGWQPEGQVSSCQQRAQAADLSSRFDPPYNAFDHYYCFVQFVVIVGLSLYIMLSAAGIDYTMRLLAVIYMAYSLYVIGMRLEGRHHAFQLELMRLLLMPGSIMVLGGDGRAVIIAVIFAALSLLSLLGLRTSPNPAHTATS